METGVLAAAEGRSIWVIGDRYTIKCDGNDTSGAFALIEAVVPPGNGPPPHIHSREDEAFYVLEGELQFYLEDSSFAATAGSWVMLARHTLHFFKNIGTKPAADVDHGHACRTGELLPRSGARGDRRGNRTRRGDPRGYPETRQGGSQVWA